jgi:UDP-N-acetylglucosamine 1-carboxyvinyltransferase
VVAAAKRLKGTRIVTDMVTVTGTENLMMAATLAEGVTVIENAAREPEVVDLADALNAMGARVSGAGTERDCDRGRRAPARRAAPGDAGPHRDRDVPDAVAAAGGEAALRGVAPHTFDAVLDKLREAGVESTADGDLLRVRMSGRPRAVSLRTAPYPGFPTDMQAQFMALDCVADGVGRITETIFENRFMHVSELQRLGANIAIEGNTAVVQGVPRLPALR